MFSGIYYFYSNSNQLTENSEAEIEILVKDEKVQAAFTTLSMAEETIERRPANEPHIVSENNEIPDQEDSENPEDYIIPEGQSYFTTDSFTEKFKNKMNKEQREQAIANVSLEIKNELMAKEYIGETEALQAFEEGIYQKEEQLKLLQTIHENKNSLSDK